MPPPPGQSGELPPGYLTGEAKVKRQRSDRRRRRLSIGIGVLVLIVAVLATLAITAQGNDATSVADLDEGECFNGDDLNDIATVDCDEPHQSQLYDVIDAPDPSIPYPADTVQADGDTACGTAFDAFYGATNDVATTNGLGLRAVPPSQEQWDNGETATYCLVQGLNGDALQGSMAGKGAG